MKETSQKKLLLLGGLRYLIPVIDAAHELGIYVITCDYLPDNIAHKYSDEYHNISIIDKKAVLSLARDLQIDGIMSFAVDPGVTTAAYVAEQLGLPSAGSYKSISILQNKESFRKFLEENDFNVPRSKGYNHYQVALEDKDYFEWPVIVKPVDSAGSKGVTRVDKVEDLEAAAKHALDNSWSGQFIVEEFIEKQGCSSDTDCFSVDGELKFVSFSAQRFDDKASNPYTPSAYSWPSTMTKEQEGELTSEIQRLLSLLKMGTSIYNIEARVSNTGKTYIMEVSPRGGGNRLAEMLYYATGVNLIRNAVRAAVGEPVTEVEQQEYNGYWAEIILHADRDGIFEKLEIEESLQKKVQEIDLWVKTGHRVNAFNGANDAIGTLVLKFDEEEEMKEILVKQSDYLKVVLK